jgi:hypothetical protein
MEGYTQCISMKKIRLPLARGRAHTLGREVTMSLEVVASVYTLAVLAALLLLYYFHAQAWYFHALSVILGLGLGFVQMPPQWAGPALDLTVGFFFILLMLWGLGAPFFKGSSHHANHHVDKHA